MTTLFEFLASLPPNDIITFNVIQFINKYQIKINLNFTLIDLLRDVIIKNDKVLLESMIDKVKDINECDTSYKSPLIAYAAQLGRYEILKILLDKKALIEVNDKSALYFALDKDNINVENLTDLDQQMRFKCAEKLINRGANIECVKKYPCMYNFVKYLKGLLTELNSLKENNGQGNKIVKLYPTCDAFSKITGILMEDTPIALFDSSFDKQDNKMLIKDILIEIPNIKTKLSFSHQLPIGTKIHSGTGSDVEEITEVTYCRFDDNVKVNINGEQMTLKNIYHSQ